jgi:hypothetical protein
MSAHDSTDRYSQGARVNRAAEEPTWEGKERQPDVSQDDVVLIVDRAIMDDDEEDFGRSPSR